MARRALSIPSMPTLAIAAGATSPNPGVVNAYCFSSVENDLIVWNGVSWRVAGKGGAATPLYALSDLGAANYYGTPAAGGEAGVSTGFGSILAFVPRALSRSTYSGLAGRTDGSTAGWFAQVNSSQQGGFSARGTSAWSEPLTRTMLPIDVNRVHCLVGLHSASFVRVALDSMAFVTQLAVTGYTVSGNPHCIGRFSGGNGAPQDSILSHLTFRGMPTDATIQALLDVARTQGDLPSTMPVPYVGEAAVTSLAPVHWFRADTVTTSSGNVATVPNKGSGGGQMNVQAGTVAAPVADADFGGQPCFVFNGSSYMRNSLAATAWRFLHDGTGAEVWCVYRAQNSTATQMVYGTRTEQGGDAGVSCVPTSTTSVRYTINGTTSTNVINTSTTGNAQTPLFSCVAYSETSAPKVAVYHGMTTIYAGAANNAGTSVDPLYPFAIGGSSSGVILLTGKVAEVVIFNRVLRADERDAMRHYIHHRYQMATGMAASITHRWSLKDALSGTSVVDGQAAPASLSDTITSATPDLMTRQGAPTVKVIDVGNDGRKINGVLGFTADSYLQASAVVLQGSATGIGLFGRALIGDYSGAEEFIVGNYDSAGGQGWTLYTTPTGGGTLRIYVVGMGDISLGVVPAGADVTWAFSWDGTSYTGYVNGVATVGPTAASSFIRNTTAALRVGRSTTSNGAPATKVAVYLLAGCDAALTATEIATMHASVRSTGTASLPAGKLNPNLFDLSLDITSNGGASAGVPALFANRGGGTATLARVGGLEIDGTGLTGFASNNHAHSMSTGLEGAATGFWVEALVTPRGIGPAAIVSHYYTGPLGYSFFCDAAGPSLGISNGTTGVSTSQYSVNANALNHIAFVFTGSQLKLYTNGTLRLTQAHAGFALQAGQNTYIGVQNVSQWPTGKLTTVHGVGGGKFVPSDAEIATAASSALSAGKLVGVPSKTDRRWSIVDDVAEAGGRVPSILKERVTGTDYAPLLNNKLEVARRTERAWGYETQPVTQGFMPTASGTYYESTASGHDGGAQGKSVAVLFRLDSQFVSKPRELFSLGTDAGQRIAIRSIGAHNALNISWHNGAGFTTTPAVTLTTADIGKLLLVVTQYDPYLGRVRVFHKRNEVGTGSTLASFFPGTGNMVRVAMIHTAASYPNYFCDEASHFAVMTADVAWSLPEIHALFDAVASEEDLIAVPNNRTGHLWSLKQAIGTTNTLPSSVLDQVGSSALTRVGTPALRQHFAHAVGW